MIKFFRHIRKNLLIENKTSKYFKYAIGEIILVVIGILIALQVSNWNDVRKQTNLLNSYYSKLYEEVVENIKYTQRLIKYEDTLIEQQRRSLQILRAKRVEDIPELKKNIGAVATAWTSDFSFTTFNEFIQKGLITEVKNQKVKQNLKALELGLTNFKDVNVYIENQYNNLIEPFFAKYINYSVNAMTRYRGGLIEGGPETDFGALFNSMELWNVVTFKLETTNLSKWRYTNFLNLLEELKHNLDDYKE